MADILKRIKEYSTISIVGMDKNVGKTTVLNYILEKAGDDTVLGLTSTGRDGEDTDRVTFTSKPRIYVRKGTFIATARQCLSYSDVTCEIVKSTGMNTPMGEVMIVRALSDGNVELAGPSINTYMESVCRDLIRAGSSLVIVDGALGRRTPASPAVTEAAILSTGASLSGDMEKVVEMTAHTVRLLSLEREKDDAVLNLCRTFLKDARVAIIRKDGGFEILPLATSLDGSREISQKLDEGCAYVMARGAVSDRLLEGIMESTDKYRGVTFLVEDGARVFVTGEVLDKFLKRGGRIRAMEKINILCITANPVSPFGYRFNKDEFLKALRDKIGLPVFDVVGGG